MLCLHCCKDFPLVVVSGGYSLVSVHGLLIVVVCFSGCPARALGLTGFGSFGSQALEQRLSSCGAWPQLLHGMWNPTRPGIGPMSPALAVELFMTEPPGKPLDIVYPENSASVGRDQTMGEMKIAVK